MNDTVMGDLWMTLLWGESVDDTVMRDLWMTLLWGTYAGHCYGGPVNDIYGGSVDDTVMGLCG